MNKRLTLIGVFALLIAVLMASFYFYVRNRGDGVASIDKRRAQDVLSLSWRIVFFDKMNQRLPASLSELNENGKWPVPADPVTSVPYSYTVLSSNSFELCAIFDSSSKSNVKDSEAIYYGDPVVHNYGYWIHGKGRRCLNRVIP